MDTSRQSLAGKLVDAIFILTIGLLLYKGRINEWAGVLLLGGIAQARGAVGVTGKLAGLLGGQAGPQSGPPSGDPPAPGGASSGSGGGSDPRAPRRDGGGIWRERARGLALSSGVALAAASVLGSMWPGVILLGKARSAGLLALVVVGVACVR